MTAPKAYAIEQAVWKSRATAGWWRESVGAAEAAELAHRFDATLTVKRTTGYSGGCYYSDRHLITLGRYAVRWLVLHEIAHGFAAKNGGHRGHGATWRGYYVAIVGQAAGYATAERLRAAFEFHGFAVPILDIIATSEQPATMLAYN